mmetsp:Transcript_83468/g.226263  ORF Transcript_83468/g.226263 Transcript_83468/m.226263 type:complete len:210 (-) Transcript_83468:202-831(-)
MLSPRLHHILTCGWDHSVDAQLGHAVVRKVRGLVPAHDGTARDVQPAAALEGDQGGGDLLEADVESLHHLVDVALALEHGLGLRVQGDAHAGGVRHQPVEGAERLGHLPLGDERVVADAGLPRVAAHLPQRAAGAAVERHAAAHAQQPVQVEVEEPVRVVPQDHHVLVALARPDLGLLRERPEFAQLLVQLCGVASGGLAMLEVPMIVN